jgi:uncharacterized membrane protein
MITSRLEAFSDGVFAIAFTLLVLEFHPPALNVPLTGYLSSLWPSFLAYSISFLSIGLVWANHHSMFVHIRRVDRPLLFLNTMLLADVAFLPFPTQLLAQALRLRADLSTAAFVYGLVLTIGGLFFNGIWLYAIRHRSLMSEKMPECRYRAAQNEQWCLDAKSVSICGRGGTSDMTCATSNDGHGTAADDGSPLAAKFAQAVRMRAASASWSRLSGT